MSKRSAARREPLSDRSDAAAARSIDRALRKLVARCAPESTPPPDRDPLGPGGARTLAMVEEAGASYCLVRLPSVSRRTLTPQQRRIARCVAAGESDKEIARRLDLSAATVATHIGRIYNKLGIGSRVELTIYCLGNP